MDRFTYFLCLAGRADFLARVSVLAGELVSRSSRKQRAVFPNFHAGMANKLNARISSGGIIGLERKKFRTLSDTTLVQVSKRIIHIKFPSEGDKR